MRVAKFIFAAMGLAVLSQAIRAQEVNREVEPVDPAVNRTVDPAVNADVIDNAKRQPAAQGTPKKPQALSTWSSAPAKPAIPFSEWSTHPITSSRTKTGNDNLWDIDPSNALKNTAEQSVANAPRRAPGPSRDQLGRLDTTRKKTPPSPATFSNEPDSGLSSPLALPSSTLKYSLPFGGKSFEPGDSPFKPSKPPAPKANPVKPPSPKPAKAGDVPAPFQQKP